MAAGSGLRKKVGPLPVWVWGLIVAAVLAWWLFFRRSNQGTTATVGDGGTAQSVLLPQDNAAGMNAAQAGQPSTVSAPADNLSSDVLQTLAAQNSTLVQGLVGAMGAAFSANASPYATSTGYPTMLAGTGDSGLQTPGYPQQYLVQPSAPQPEQVSQPQVTVTAPVRTAQVSSTSAKAQTSQPFGGVVSKTKLKNGATLTTYASGRQVEQAPGKSAYVVRS